MRQPENESARKALHWISEQRSADPSAKVAALIDEAGRRYDLNPREQEALIHWLADIRPESS